MPAWGSDTRDAECWVPAAGIHGALHHAELGFLILDLAHEFSDVHHAIPDRELSEMS